MTLVRKPSRSIQSEPGKKDNWLRGPKTPSRQTVVKAESTKRYFDAYYDQLFQEQNSRESRLNKLKDEIDRQMLSEEDKQKLLEQYEKEEADYVRFSRMRLKPTRFERLKLIGRGGFGEVWLVQDKYTKLFYALKVLSKANIIRNDQIENVRTERDLLSAADNPWFTYLHCSFQDEERLYLVLEYVPGGDLMTALIKKGVFSENEARFFCGEIALAVHAVHQMHFLHRDLKPDNVLIAENGHIKLTDFGLSKNYGTPETRLQKLNDELIDLLMAQIPDGPSHERGTDIGTCSYTAPEILRRQPPTPLSDFWSLGVILYEMLFGYTPFMGRSPNETPLRIMYWRRVLKFPPQPSVSAAAVDLIQHLLCDTEDRFGFEQIAAHPFFEGFDFTNYAANAPPFLPVLRSPTDTSHFDDLEPEENSLASEVPYAELARFAFLGYTVKPRPQHHTAQW